MTKEVYSRILKKHVIPSGSRIIGERFVFQEDNEPKHSPKFSRNHLSELENDKIIERMIWPPQSPDLSPIEFLWNELERNVNKLMPKSEEDMRQKLKNDWHKEDFQKLENLLCRMPLKYVKHIDESKL